MWLLITKIRRLVGVDDGMGSHVTDTSWMSTLFFLLLLYHSSGCLCLVSGVHGSGGYLLRWNSAASENVFMGFTYICYNVVL